MFLKENTLEWITKIIKIWTTFLFLFTCLIFTGCEGTDSREKVDDTVKELSGQTV